MSSDFQSVCVCEVKAKADSLVFIASDVMFIAEKEDVISCLTLSCDGNGQGVWRTAVSDLSFECSDVSLAVQCTIGKCFGCSYLFLCCTSWHTRNKIANLS